MTLTFERLRERLAYDPDTGAFRWRVATKGNRAGDLAGGRRPDGYRRIVVDGRLYYAHRLAWLYQTGENPSHFVDHINGDPSDNRWVNLREATNSQNLCNRGAMNGLKGASFMAGRNRWRATIQVNGRQKSLGTYETEAEAHAAYVAALADTHGAFGRQA